MSSPRQKSNIYPSQSQPRPTRPSPDQPHRVQTQRSSGMDITRQGTVSTLSAHLLSHLRSILRHGVAIALLSISASRIAIILAGKLTSEASSVFIRFIRNAVSPFLENVARQNERHRDTPIIRPTLIRSLAALLGINAEVAVPRIQDSPDKPQGQRLTSTSHVEGHMSEETSNKPTTSSEPSVRTNREAGFKKSSHGVSFMGKEDSPVDTSHHPASPSDDEIPPIVRRATEVVQEINEELRRPSIPVFDFVPLLDISTPSSHRPQDRRVRSSPGPELIITSKWLPPEDQVPPPRVEMSIGLWQQHLDHASWQFLRLRLRWRKSKRGNKSCERVKHVLQGFARV